MATWRGRVLATVLMDTELRVGVVDALVIGATTWLAVSNLECKEGSMQEDFREVFFMAVRTMSNNLVVSKMGSSWAREDGYLGGMALVSTSNFMDRV